MLRAWTAGRGGGAAGPGEHPGDREPGQGQHDRRGGSRGHGPAAGPDQPSRLAGSTDSGASECGNMLRA
jgi:hypothetical protein